MAESKAEDGMEAIQAACACGQEEVASLLRLASSASSAAILESLKTTPAETKKEEKTEEPTRDPTRLSRIKASAEAGSEFHQLTYGYYWAIQYTEDPQDYFLENAIHWCFKACRQKSWLALYAASRMKLYGCRSQSGKVFIEADKAKSDQLFEFVEKSIPNEPMLRGNESGVFFIHFLEGLAGKPEQKNAISGNLYYFYLLKIFAQVSPANQNKMIPIASSLLKIVLSTSKGYQDFKALWSHFSDYLQKNNAAILFSKETNYGKDLIELAIKNRDEAMFESLLRLNYKYARDKELNTAMSLEMMRIYNKVHMDIIMSSQPEQLTQEQRRTKDILSHLVSSEDSSSGYSPS